MTTTRFLRISGMLCLAAMMLSAAAHAQPPGGRGGDEEGGRQRGQRGGGGGGEQGGRQRGGGGGGQQRGGGGQQRGGFGGQRGGTQRTPTITRAMLLGNEDVQRELEIGDGQAAVIDAAIEAYNESKSESRPDFSKIQDMSEEERAEFFAKMTKEREKLTKETDTTLNALLEPEQVERLDQIVFQIKTKGNLLALMKSDEEVKKALKVTDEQIAKMEEASKAGEEAMSKMREEMRAAFSGGGERPDFTEMRTKMEAVQKEGTNKMMAVFTDEQKARMKEMKGDEFEFDMRSLMRGGGRGGQGGGGGRGGQGGPGGGRGGQGGGGGGRGGQGGGGRGGQGGGGERQRPPVEDDII